jgi:putative membrane protein
MGFILVCEATRGFGGLFVHCIPRKTRYQRAALDAMRIYYARCDALPKDKPFVLLFVSLAERYVHIVTNPVVHQRVASDWHVMTDTFSQSIRADGLRPACIVAVAKITERLVPHFPMQSIPVIHRPCSQ